MEMDTEEHTGHKGRGLCSGMRREVRKRIVCKGGDREREGERGNSSLQTEPSASANAANSDLCTESGSPPFPKWMENMPCVVLTVGNPDPRTELELLPQPHR